jgi:membrane protease YdiL (CAAX protease family)
VNDGRRLVGWSLLVGFLIAVQYAARATSGKPDPDTLYDYSTAAGSVLVYGVILLLVLVIAGFRRDLLALRPPVSIARALGILVVALVAIQVVEYVYIVVTDLGNEQGLTPERWQPAHATEYVVNGIVICTVVPFVEELTYRGLGFSLLSRFGRWPAIVLVGILFALSHGLFASLPILAVFGSVLAWIRSVTRSVFPGMLLHAAFNAVALTAAVTLGN